MKVEAVDNKKHYVLGPLVKGAAIGATAGYILKYAQPITPQERNNPEYKQVMDKINKERTSFNPITEMYRNNIKSKKVLTPAEDTFVKMFDGLKQGESLNKSTIKNAFSSLNNNKNEIYVAQFKRLCRDYANIANKTAEQCIKAYNLLTKHARPTGFFLITGAVVGAIITMIKDIMKTEIKC